MLYKPSQARLHSALSFCASLAQAKSDHKVGPAYNSVGATPQLWHMDKKGQRAPRPSSALRISGTGFGGHGRLTSSVSSITFSLKEFLTGSPSYQAPGR
ncbi:hypothetical protein WJX79_001812 [Trebouxia sp. C0005]